MGLLIPVLFVTCPMARASFHTRGQGTVEGESRAQPNVLSSRSPGDFPIPAISPRVSCPPCLKPS